jgi:ribosomal protein S18 acetylase RimI-like enzyme
MPEAVDLRRPTAEHYQFALDLYLLTMRPYTELLMVWDEAKQRNSFSAQWKLEEVLIVVVDGKEVGWLQIADLQTEIRLQQLFIAPAHQRRGIGTQVLRGLVATWKQKGKPVLLTILKSNPARRLYERVGFSVIGEIGVKYEMKYFA